MAFNIMLFVPFGGLLRHLSGRGITTATVSGFAVSLGVELTQLTGVRTLYPCAYRLFDVDDLLTNVSDLLAIVLTGAALNALYRYLFLDGLVVADGFSRLVFWLLPALGQLALAWWTGATLAEHTVRLRPGTSSGRLTARAALMRWAVGIGGFSLLQLPGTGVTSLLAVLFAVASLVADVRTRGHRGLAYRVARLDIIDERQPLADKNHSPLTVPARYNAPPRGCPCHPSHVAGATKTTTPRDR